MTKKKSILDKTVDVVALTILFGLGICLVVGLAGMAAGVWLDFFSDLRVARWPS